MGSPLTLKTITDCIYKNDSGCWGALIHLSQNLARACKSSLSVALAFCPPPCFHILGTNGFSSWVSFALGISHLVWSVLTRYEAISSDMSTQSK